jgi:hypothetical protein
MAAVELLDQQPERRRAGQVHQVVPGDEVHQEEVVLAVGAEHEGRVVGLLRAPDDFVAEAERLDVERDRGADVIDGDLNLARPGSDCERWHGDSLLEEAVGVAKLGGQQISLAFQAAAAAGQDLVRRRPGGVVDDPADLLDRQAVPAQHRDLPGPPRLLAPVPAVAGSRIDAGRGQQADLVVMPQGGDGQASRANRPMVISSSLSTTPPSTLGQPESQDPPGLDFLGRRGPRPVASVRWRPSSSARAAAASRRPWSGS